MQHLRIPTCPRHSHHASLCQRYLSHSRAASADAEECAQAILQVYCMCYMFLCHINTNHLDQLFQRLSIDSNVKGCVWTDSCAKENRIMSSLTSLINTPEFARGCTSPRTEWDTHTHTHWRSNFYHSWKYSSLGVSSRNKWDTPKRIFWNSLNYVFYSSNRLLAFHVASR